MEKRNGLYNRFKTYIKNLTCLEKLIRLIIILSFISISAFFIAALCSNSLGWFFNWNNNFLPWILSSLGVMATAITGIIIYSQFREQKLYTRYTMYPKLTVSESDIQFHDTHNEKNFHATINHRENITLRTDIINRSINYGYIRVGVIASLFDDRKYIINKLSGARGQKLLNMEEDIFVSPEGIITNDYTFPHHFTKDDEEKQKIFNLIKKYEEERKDYCEINDHGYYYLCFIIRVKLDKDTPWIYDINKYYYFNFSNNTYSEVLHLPKQIEDYIKQEKKKHGWENT